MINPANIMDTPPPSPSAIPKKRIHPSVIVIIWIVIGIIWSCAQFAISEVTYRIGMAMESGVSDRLFEISDTVSWPAVHLYDRALAEEYVDEIQGALRVSAFDQDELSKLQNLLSQYQGDYDNIDFQESADELLNAKDIYPEVSVPMEYLIYGGTCIAWGALIAILGSGLTLLIRTNYNRHE